MDGSTVFGLVSTAWQAASTEDRLKQKVPVQVDPAWYVHARALTRREIKALKATELKGR